MTAIATCPRCGGTIRRSSTPTTGDGRRRFWRHVDTGFTACSTEEET